MGNSEDCLQLSGSSKECVKNGPSRIFWLTSENLSLNIVVY